MSHTPGPWETHNEGDGFNSVRVCKPEASRERGCYAIAEAEIVGVLREEAEANAHLIASAPDLLAVLKAQGHGESRGKCWSCRRPWPCPAAQAIAAAEGREP